MWRLRLGQAAICSGLPILAHHAHSADMGTRTPRGSSLTIPIVLLTQGDPASRKAETILFLHSTSPVKHLGRRLTLSANALYVGRVVTSAAAKLPH